MKGKELAIKVAEKLGDGYKYLDDDDIGYMYNKDKDDDLDIDKYLHAKAAEILFSEGTAEKIRWQVEYNYYHHDGDPFIYWFDTLTPQKILTTWLEMEGE